MEDGVLYDGTEDEPQRVLDMGSVQALPGVHNWQNAAAAYAATKAAGVNPHAIMACIQSYPGLVHRQEMVSVVDGVGYINDSKATNPEAAARALACCDTIYWIAGGRPKEGGLEALEPYFGRIAHAYLIGEAADAFARVLEGKVELTLSGDLETAVKQARTQAMKDEAAEPVVLLSPACASFDQFDNFEARGNAFRELVEKLPGRHEESFGSGEGENQ